MPNPVWPSALCPAGLEWRLQKAGIQFSAPYSGSLQAADFVGEYWEMIIKLHGEGRMQVNSGLLDATLMYLAGGINQVDVYHWRRPIPRGTLRGSPVIQIATARADAQLVLSVPAGATLEAGDFIGAGSQLFMVLSPCAAVDTTLTVPLVNRVRSVIDAGTAVVWDKPALAALMPEMSAGLVYTPGQTLPAEIRLMEAARVVEAVAPPSTSESMLDFSVAANSMYVPVLAL